MKTLTTILKKSKKLMLAAICMSFTVMTYAQADGINYQAAIRDGSGNLVKNQNIDLKFTISEGSTAIYTEEHTGINSSAQGLVNVVIGKGTALSGRFEDVVWTDKNQENLKVEVDLGSGYVSLGKQDFQAVPYALNVPWIKYGTIGMRYYDTSNYSTRVGINAREKLTSTHKLLELSMPNGSDDDAKFIEFFNGQHTGPFPVKKRVADIKADGSAKFKNVEVDTLGASNKPEKGTMYNESMPMAWGYIGNINANNAATIISSFGIKNATFDNISKEFKITLDNSWIGKPAVIITPVSTTSGEFAGTYNITSNSDNFRVFIRDGNNPSTKKPSSFMVVVYGRTK